VEGDDVIMVSQSDTIFNTFQHLASLIRMKTVSGRWICDDVRRSSPARRCVAVGENRFSDDAIAVRDGPSFQSTAPRGTHAQGACMPEIHCNCERRSDAEPAFSTVVAAFSIGATTPR